MTKNETLIAPSILAADFGYLADQIKEAEKGGADWVHIDVMDGHFVPNLTMGPLVVAAARRATDLPLDVHLMIENPERLVDDFATAGADSITVHLETCPHLHRTVQQIRSAECKVGVAINPATPVESLAPIMGIIDLVLIMSVNPGFGGQNFIQESLEKVSAVAEVVSSKKLNVQIQMDGGISAETIRGCVEAGANVFVAGSAVFKNPVGIVSAIKELRGAAHP